MKYAEAIRLLESLLENSNTNGLSEVAVGEELEAIDVAIEAMYRLISLED